MPVLSVVMTAYNAEQYVAESIKSILSQTYSDFEFIIINDGSSDNTDNIIKQYNDKRIKYIPYLNNRGSVPCLREAIELANGILIATQDADDISLPNRLELQTNYMVQHADIFCLGGRAIKIDDCGNFVGEWNFPLENHDDIVKMLVRDKKCPIINPTSMFHKDGYKEIGGYSIESAVVASYDLELWTKALLANKKFANIKDYLIKYRTHAQSMTQRLKWPQIAAYNHIMSHFIRKYKYVNITRQKVD
jgi:glycosyltransferase involved in cell wall biosynthesis